MNSLENSMSPLIKPVLSLIVVASVLHIPFVHAQTKSNRFADFNSHTIEGSTRFRDDEAIVPNHFESPGRALTPVNSQTYGLLIERLDLIDQKLEYLQNHLNKLEKGK